MKGRNAIAGLFLAMILVVGMGQVQAAATFTFDYSADVGEGFNSTDALLVPSQAAGNPGADLGAQRRASFQAAAARWGLQLNSTITINIKAMMDPQGACTGTFTLGAAGSSNVHANFTNAPVASTWFPAALADKIALSDLNGATSEIGATFNSQVDSAADCPGLTWFYALDNRVAPAGTVSFFSTVLHEIGHGICVASFLNSATGELFNDTDGPDTGAFGQDDYYTRYIEHHGVGMVSGLATDALRLAAVISDPSLHWVSPTVQAMLAGANLAGGVDNGHPKLFGPNPVQGGSSVSHWDETFIQTTTNKHEFMEPQADAVTGDLLTLYMCQDVGWGALNGMIPVKLQKFSID